MDFMSDEKKQNLKQDLKQIVYPDVMSLDDQVRLGILNNNIFLRHFPFLNVIVDNQYMIALKNRLDELKQEGIRRNYLTIAEINRRIKRLVIQELDLVLFYYIINDSLQFKKEFKNFINRQKAFLRQDITKWPRLADLTRQNSKRILSKYKNLFDKLYPESASETKTNKNNFIKGCVCRRKKTRGGKKRSSKSKKKTQRRKKK